MPGTILGTERKPSPSWPVFLVVETGPPHHGTPGDKKGHAGVRQRQGWVRARLSLDRRSRVRGKYFQAEETSRLEGPGGAGSMAGRGGLRQGERQAGARTVTKPLSLCPQRSQRLRLQSSLCRAAVRVKRHTRHSAPSPARGKCSITRVNIPWGILPESEAGTRTRLC